MNLTTGWRPKWRSRPDDPRSAFTHMRHAQDTCVNTHNPTRWYRRTYTTSLTLLGEGSPRTVMMVDSGHSRGRRASRASGKVEAGLSGPLWLSRPHAHTLPLPRPRGEAAPGCGRGAVPAGRGGLAGRPAAEPAAGPCSQGVAAPTGPRPGQGGPGRQPLRAPGPHWDRPTLGSCHQSSSIPAAGGPFLVWKGVSPGGPGDLEGCLPTEGPSSCPP